MNRRLFCVALLVVSISQFCQTQQTSKTQVPADLERELSVLRQKFPGDMAIYMKNLANGDEIALDADSVYETLITVQASAIVAPETRLQPDVECSEGVEHPQASPHSSVGVVFVRGISAA